jgi:uncharacterized membrane protein
MLPADTLLPILHVTTGTLAVLAGAAALAARKGRSVHILSGRIFAASMVVSSIMGAALGLLKADQFYITFHAGILSVTLITSSLLTLRAPRLNWFHRVVNGINAANFVALAAIGFHALSEPGGIAFGFAAEDYFFLGAMAVMATICDVSLLWRKPLRQNHRIARHLWRMCFGFFIAAGSAFTGPGASAFPDIIQNSGILSLPELAILLLMLFWLVRTLMRKPETVEAASR